MIFQTPLHLSKLVAVLFAVCGTGSVQAQTRISFITGRVLGPWTDPGKVRRLNLCWLEKCVLHERGHTIDIQKSTNG